MAPAEEEEDGLGDEVPQPQAAGLLRGNGNQYHRKSPRGARRPEHPREHDGFLNAEEAVVGEKATTLQLPSPQSAVASRSSQESGSLLTPVTPGQSLPPATPAEEVRRFDMAQRSEEGGLYYLVSRKWLVEWRQWATQGSAGRVRSVSPVPAAGGGKRRVQSAGRAPLLEPLRPLSGPSGRRQLSAGPAQGRPLPQGLQERPGPVENSELLSDEGNQLLEGLREGNDYEVLSPAAWELLRGWYGGGPALRRRAVTPVAGDVAAMADRVQSALDALIAGVWQTSQGGRVTVRDGQVHWYKGTCSSIAVEAKEGSVLDVRLKVDDKVYTATGTQNELSWSDGDCWKKVDQEIPGAAEERLSAGYKTRLPTLGSDAEPEPETGLAAEEEYPWAAPRIDYSRHDSAATDSALASGSGERYPQRDGLCRRPAGLKNLGNTCFMNSSLQCLSHIPQFREYFLNGKYRDSLKRNLMVTERTGGQLAEGFRELLQRLWGGDMRSFAPWTFKDLVERFAEQFSGRRQHDAMEFIEWLVDGLKEDCNNVKGKKPYIERADANGRPDDVVALEASNRFLLRNDSAIDDMFVGFQKCVTTCPEETCGKESVVLDPFLSVKVPVASTNQSGQRQFDVNIVRLATTEVLEVSGDHDPPSPSGPPVVLHKHRVSVSKYGCAEELVRAVAEVAELQPDSCMMVEVYASRVYKFFDNESRLEDVSSSDYLVLYELATPAVFPALDDHAWSKGECVREGDLVVASTDFQSNSKKQKLIRAGQHGLVAELDDDGDVLIKFDDVEARQWIFKRNLKNLQIDLTMESEESRYCPEDEKMYKFRELVHEYQNDRSFESIRNHWRLHMQPMEEASDPAALSSGVVVCFRHPNEAGKLELFGVPLLLCVRRTITAEELSDTVMKEIKLRFGSDAVFACRLYKAPDDRTDTLLAANNLLWEEWSAPADGTEWHPGPRCHIIAEWEASPPSTLVAVDPAPVADGDEEVDLETCFEWITEVEQLSEHDSVYCSGCKKHQRSWRKVSFWSLPPILVLQFKRFEYGGGGFSRTRLSTPVRFPLEGLDLQRFCPSGSASFPSGACLRTGATACIRGLQSASGQQLNGQVGQVMYLDTASCRFCIRLNEADPPESWKRLKPENLEPVPAPGTQGPDPAPAPVFDLMSLSKHVGDASFGHYTSYARSSQDGIWRLYDDEKVMEVVPADVELERSGAYVLFYLRRDCRPPAWGPAPPP